MATRRRMVLGRRRCDVALLVATCIALSAIAPTPAAGDVFSDILAPTPAAGDVFSDIFGDLCSPENCGSVIPDACARLRADTEARLGDVSVDTLAIAQDVLTELAKKSKDLSAKCAAIRPPGPRANPIISGLVDKPVDIIKPCDYDRYRGPKCLDLFRQGKSTFKSIILHRTHDTQVTWWSGTHDTQVTWSESVTKDCCDQVTDTCLCHLKKKLIKEGKHTNFPCLQKKALGVCK